MPKPSKPATPAPTVVPQPKPNLTVDELRAVLDQLSASGAGGAVVSIPADGLNVSIGGSSCVEVTGGHQGIDWDHNRVFLSPSKPLGPRPDELLAKSRKEMSKISMFLYAISRVNRDNAFSPEEKLRQIQTIVEGFSKPQPDPTVNTTFIQTPPAPKPSKKP